MVRGFAASYDRPSRLNPNVRRRERSEMWRGGGGTVRRTCAGNAATYCVTRRRSAGSFKVGPRRREAASAPGGVAASWAAPTPVESNETVLRVGDPRAIARL